MQDHAQEEPEIVQVSARIPLLVYAAAREMCTRRRISFAKLVGDLLNEEIEADRKQQPDGGRGL
jgi:hypothetical protein